MASQQAVPPIRSLQRQQHAQRASSNPPHTTTVENEHASTSETKSSVSKSSRTESFQRRASSAPPRRADNDEPNRCWICFSDETEDTLDSSPWRSPCPCALTAHEACLLDWIADMESPGTNRSTAKLADVKCPQCKSPIHLSRSHSYIVDAFRVLESFTGRMLLPGIMTGFSYVILLGASHHGAHTIRMIFGTEDADLILAPIHTWTWFEQAAVQCFPTVATPILRGWRGLRVELGLPLIPAALIASRTSMADAVLPILPIVFFATHPQASQSLRVAYWPPSAALTFVVLPYVRSAYDEYMQRVWGPHERRWLKEIKPRQGQEDAEAAAAAQEDAGGEVDGIQIEVIIGDEEQDMPPANAPAVAPPLHAPPVDDAQGPNDFVEAEADFAAAAAAAEGDGPPQAGAGAEGQQQQQQQEARHQIRGGTEQLVSIAQRAGSSLLGALLFPTAAAASGEILRLLLPLSWTIAARGPRGQLLPPTGFFQTRWGRSVVGGCLFVVLKDAIRIYCRWRTAKDFRNRRVLNWDKKAGKFVD